MEEGADVGDVGMGRRKEGVPLAERCRLRPAQGQMILVLVDAGVGRIEVGVDRRQRRQGVAGADDGTRRHVADDGQGGVDGKLAGADIEGAAVEEVAVGDALPLVGEAQALAIKRERLLVVSGLGQDEGSRAARRAVASVGDIEVAGSLAGGIVQDLDDPDEGGGAIHHRRRAFQHLDALDVIEVEGRNHRIEGAAPGDAIDDQEEGVELVQTPEGGDSAGGSRIAARRRLDAGDEGDGGGHVPGIATSDLGAGDDREVGGDPAKLLGGPCGGDHHFGERRCWLVCLGRGGRRGGGRRRILSRRRAGRAGDHPDPEGHPLQMHRRSLSAIPAATATPS